MNKKKLLLLIALMAVVAYLVLRNQTQTANNQDDVPVADSEIEVGILTVNDIHSAIDQFPKFAALVDSLRAEYPDLLLFSAGDNRTGNPVNDQFKPTNHPIITLMNRVGFDLSAVGNHEWDANIGPLQADIERARFPFLCANVFVPDSVKLDLKPFEVIENHGLRLAVVGMIELRADGLPGAHPDNLKKVSFKRAEKVIPEYKYLKNQSDAFILLSHCGLDHDLELAQANPWMDVIIGGHTHTLIKHPSETNGVLITQSGSHLKHATLVKLRFKDGKLVGKDAIVLDVSKTSGENRDVAKMVADFNNAPVLKEALATAVTKFENREELGCMMTDAIREASGADFAFQNTGGLRIDYLKKGPITVKDVYTIDPFCNEIVVFQMTGQQLKRFIVNTYKKNGGFPSYVSGMTYVISDNGKGVFAFVTPDKGDFSTTNIYKVALNSYMAATVNIESVDEGQSLHTTTEEALIEFLRKYKTVDYQGVSRIKQKMVCGF